MFQLCVLFLAALLAMVLFPRRKIGLCLLGMALVLTVFFVNEQLFLHDVQFASNVPVSELVGTWERQESTLTLSDDGTFAKCEKPAGIRSVGKWKIVNGELQLGKEHLSLLRYRGELRLQHLEDPDDLSRDLGFQKIEAKV